MRTQNAENRLTKIPLSGLNTGDVIEKMELYPVQKVGMMTDTGATVENFRSMVNHKNEVISVVGKDYEAFQMHEVLSVFTTAVPDPKWEIGYRNNIGGRFVLQSLAGLAFQGTDEETKMYMTVSNSFDGGEAVRVMIAPCRMFCLNQMPKTLTYCREHSTIVSIKHTKNMRAAVDQVLRVVAAVPDAMAAYEKNVEALKNRTVTMLEVERLCNMASASPRTAERMIEKFSNGLGTYGKTAWDALNGIVEAIDYDRDGEINHARALFSGDSAKDKICSEVLKMAY